MRRLLSCLGAVVLSFSALSAAAQEAPRADLFAGYSYVNFYIPQLADAAAGSGLSINSRANLHGFAVSSTTWFTRNLGVEGEVAAHFSGGCFGISGLHCHDVSFMGGPKLAHRSEKATVFVHGLFGGDNGSLGALGISTSDTKWAMAAGGGVDVNISPRYAIRVAQVDYFLTNHIEGLQHQNNIRAAAGIVFHFGGTAAVYHAKGSSASAGRTPLSGPIRIPSLGATVARTPSSHGLELVEVEDGKPAAVAGLRHLDVIVQVDGKDVTTVEELQESIAAAKAGHVAIKYMYLGTPQYMTVMVQF